MIVKSILDTDLYKFTTSYAYMKLFPHAIGTFEFFDRDNTEYTEEFVQQLRMEIVYFCSLHLTQEEQDYMTTHCRFIPPIHDITPYMRSRHRGSEIQEWLDKQTEPYRYVIFDDDTDMLDSQLPYFIQSDWLKWGLSDEDVEQAIHILNDTNTTAEAHL